MENFKRALKGLPPAVDLSEAFEITRSLPHGHVAAVLGTARALGIDELLGLGAVAAAGFGDGDAGGPGDRARIEAGHRARVAHRNRHQFPGPGSRASVCDEDDLYAAMDWALERKDGVENALAARHLVNGTLVLYDVSSAAFEGRTCPLGKIGHARDGVKGRLQIVYGLLCSPAGIPIAIEVFEGSTADPKTLAAQITKLKTRFGLARVCLVGDRGMLTNARIRDEIRPAQLEWISALRAPRSTPSSTTVRCNCRCLTPKTSSRSTPRTSPASGWCAATTPCWPPDRTRKRGELLAATEKDLAPITPRPPGASGGRCAGGTASRCGLAR